MRGFDSQQGSVSFLSEIAMTLPPSSGHSQNSISGTNGPVGKAATDPHLSALSTASCLL